MSAMQKELVPLLMMEGKITNQIVALEEDEQAEFSKMLNECHRRSKPRTYPFDGSHGSGATHARQTTSMGKQPS